MKQKDIGHCEVGAMILASVIAISIMNSHFTECGPREVPNRVISLLC